MLSHSVIYILSYTGPLFSCLMISYYMFSDIISCSFMFFILSLKLLIQIEKQLIIF